MRRGLLIGALTISGVVSCGEVPTLDQGIAYISPLILPAPAVAVGDTLRDSLGRATPLRIEAFGRNDEQLPDPEATFLTVILPSPVKVGSTTGIVTASDTVTTVHTVQLVGRVGSRLQTTQASLLVVPQPDSLERISDEVRSARVPALDTLRVKVTGLNAGKVRVPVPGIIVRYRITGVFGSGASTASTVLTLDGGVVSRPDSLVSVDTTDASGLASRTLVVAGQGLDSVVVFARARSLRGEPLKGDSLHFVLRVTP